MQNVRHDPFHVGVLVQLGFRVLVAFMVCRHRHVNELGVGKRPKATMSTYRDPLYRRHRFPPEVISYEETVAPRNGS